MHKRGS